MALNRMFFYDHAKRFLSWVQHWLLKYPIHIKVHFWFIRLSGRLLRFIKYF